MATKRLNWFLRLVVMFYGSAEHSAEDEPRASPEATAANCPMCGTPLDRQLIDRTEGQGCACCPSD